MPRLGSQKVLPGAYRVDVHPGTLYDQISVLVAYLTPELTHLHTFAFENDLETGGMQIHPTAVFLCKLPVIECLVHCVAKKGIVQVNMTSHLVEARLAFVASDLRDCLVNLLSDVGGNTGS